MAPVVWIADRLKNERRHGHVSRIVDIPVPFEKLTVGADHFEEEFVK